MRERIFVLQNDIWRIGGLDAIICHASEDLEPTDMTTRMLFDAAGDKVRTECDRLTSTTTSIDRAKSVITVAGKLRVKNLIHCVLGDERYLDDNILMAAIRGAFQMAQQEGFKTIALPLLGAGNDDHSGEITTKRAAEVLVAEAKKVFDIRTCIEKIIFIVSEDAHYEAIEDALRQI